MWNIFKYSHTVLWLLGKWRIKIKLFPLIFSFFFFEYQFANKSSIFALNWSTNLYHKSMIMFSHFSSTTKRWYAVWKLKLTYDQKGFRLWRNHENYWYSFPFYLIFILHHLHKLIGFAYGQKFFFFIFFISYNSRALNKNIYFIFLLISFFVSAWKGFYLFVQYIFVVYIFK